MSRRAGVGVLAIGCLALYAARLDSAAGLYVDDAWYVVLAKAIAQGDGYRLISSATAPIVPTFPPGFPLLLAPVVAVFPSFPDNVAPLKAVSIGAMFALAAASFHYLRQYRGAPPAVAAAAALTTLLMPAFVFLATSTIMAEAVFTLCVVVLAINVERTARAEGMGYRMGAIAGVVAGATLLVRVAGIAAAGAAVWYLWRTRPRAAAVFAAVTVAMYVPWAGYNIASGDTSADRLAHGGGIAYRYSELLSFRVGGEPGSGRMSLSDLPPRVVDNVVNIFSRDVGAQLFPSAYRGADESGQEVFLVSGLRGFRATGMGTGAPIVLVSSALSIIVVIGLMSAWRRGATFAEWMVIATIAMVLLVPVQTFRYMLPLAPFVAFYFFAGIDAVAALIRRSPTWQFGASFRVGALCILLMFFVDHLGYLQAVRADKATWLWSQQDVRGVTDWMNANLDTGGVATSNPGLVWLMTNRPTIALMNPSAHWQQWRKNDIRYAAALMVAPRPPRSLGYELVLRISSLQTVGNRDTAGPDRK